MGDFSLISCYILSDSINAVTDFSLSNPWIFNVNVGEHGKKVQKTIN